MQLAAAPAAALMVWPLPPAVRRLAAAAREDRLASEALGDLVPLPLPAVSRPVAADLRVRKKVVGGW